EGGQGVGQRAVEPEADREADGRGDEQAPDQHGGVGQGPSGQDGAPGDGQGAEAVDQSLLEVLGDAGGRAHAGEQDAGGDEPGYEEVDVVQASGPERPAEDVPEDQQEERALDGAQDHQLGGAQVLEQAPPGDAQGAGRQRG